MITILILIVIGLPVLVVSVDNKYKKNITTKKMETEEIKKKYKVEHDIPDNADMCDHIELTIKGEKLEERNIFVWKDDANLYLCGENDKDEIKKIVIPINYIQFYTRKGDYRIELVSSGGGINIGNAILGGLTGAILGLIISIFVIGGILVIVGFGIGALLSGKEKIVMNNKEIDNRKTYLNYSEEGLNIQIIFSSKVYDVLLNLIPKKELDCIENYKTIELNKNQNENSIYRDIDELSKLRDKGILTEHEFNQKKQLLLDRI